jgi:hypothetical protein
LAVSSWLLAVGYLLLAVCYWQLAVSSLLLAVGFLLFAVRFWLVFEFDFFAKSQ